MKILERRLFCQRCHAERAEQITPDGITQNMQYKYPLGLMPTLSCKSTGHDWHLLSTHKVHQPGAPPAPVADVFEELEFNQYRDDLIAFREYREGLLKRYPPHE